MNFRVYLLLILLATGCAEKESPAPSPLTGDELISMKFNDQYLVTYSDVQVSYYNNTLEIFADSIYSSNGASDHYELRLYGAAEQGINQISQNIYFELMKYESDGFLRQLTAENGAVNFTEFNITEGHLTGSFDMTLKDVNSNTEYQLTDGLFNNLSIIELFFEADLPTYSHDTISLFNKWGLISIQKSNGESIIPPCGSTPSLWIYPETFDTGEYISMSGTVNGAACSVSIDEDNQLIITEEPVVTFAYDNPWGNDFEKLYFQSFLESNLSYEYTADELIIFNEKDGVELFFVPIE